MLHRSTIGTSRLADYQAALNHRQCFGFATGPRRTGFAGNAVDFRVNGLPEVEFPLRPRASDRVGDPLTSAIFGTEGAAVIPGERQGVRIARYVVAPTGIEFPFGVLTETHRLPPLFVAAQRLQTNGMNRGDAGVQHADPLLRSVTVCHPAAK
jgi:hypothetical protein